MQKEKPSETGTAIHELKREIDRLNSKQVEALRTAAYGGMNTHEAREYDERRIRITELVKQLATLVKPD